MEKIRVTPKKKKIIPADPKIASFPVVGIGGSAGGLEAFQELLKNMSAKPGIALVFIMHLAPGHKSILTELLARVTKLPVSEITNGMPLEVNHVYVLPPRVDVSIASGKLILSNMKGAGLRRMPIDYFFRSLAEEQGNRAIGVILSGTATDGTLGAEVIKTEGGIVFAQDEESAAYNGMPQNAIAAGCVDFVLSPGKIARELERIAKHHFISPAGAVKTDKSIVTEDKGLESIFDILRSTKGLDFTHYKTTTISRRVSRRILLLKLENLKHYIKFLRENKDEVEKLYEDLLLNVTSFFRAPKVFHALKNLVLTAILKNKTKDQEVRIWVPGCSSGEEAYSIAICLIELLGNKTSVVPIKIFATDVSESGINKARRGMYGANIKNDVTPERLKRFFTKEGNSYKISKSLREICIFSKHNVFSNPPFSNLDLISCRNLLIYLQPVLQKSVFHKFHYGLRPGGFLLLGNSESVSGYSNFFEALDRKQRIFVKKYLSIEPKLELDLGQKYYQPKKLEINENAGIRKGKETHIESMVERIVLSEYAPCGVLIDSDMEVVSFRGHTGHFLESVAGKPSLNIFKLAREGLFLPLRAAIFKARETKHTVKREALDVRYNGRKVRVNITVVPAKYGPLEEELFLVLFDEIGRAVESKDLPKARRDLSSKGKSVKGNEYINNSQKELAETKEYLKTIIEEHENAIEEVKTATEEILSTNEELQSTNEELETATEELQSSNEELITTNEELQNRNKEVVLLNDDLINLLGSTNIPIIMMGKNLVIRRITPQAEKALNVIPSDIGRPISKIKLNVDIPDFEKILLDVIESLHSKTFEIKSGGGNWYSVYIRPYQTINNKIDGVVAIFIDITERKKAQQKIEEARTYAESIIETMREPLIVLDTDLKVISANRSFHKTFKVNPKETKGQFIYDLGNRQWDIPKLRELLEDILPNKSTFDNYEIEHTFKTIGLKTMLLNARRLENAQMILLTIDDITERKRIEGELVHANEENFRSIFDNAGDGILLAEIGAKKFYMGNNSICRMLGYSPEEIVNLGVMDIHPEKDLPYVTDQFERQAKGEFALSSDLPIKRKDGSVFYADVNGTTVTIAGKIHLMGFFHDTTERKQAEDLLRESEVRYRSIYVASHDAIMTLEPPTWKFTSGNPATIEMFKAKNEAEFLSYEPWKLSPELQPDGRASDEKAKEMIETAMREGSHFFEWVHKRISGEEFLTDVLLSRVEQGGRAFLHAVVRDYTEQKMAEEERRCASELKTATEIKSKFTSMVSHELRSPLGVIKEGINLVLEGLAGNINDEQKDLLDTAKKNTDRLTRLINDVLDFDKMESGKMEFDIRENDINEVALEVRKAMSLLTEEKGLDLVVDVDDSIPKIRFDKDKIIQVFTNLVSNAIKFTEKGSISISTKQEDNMVHGIVQDTGVGIEAKDMQKLFQAFEQIDNIRDKKKCGTGLGLAISKEIILVHKGKIWAESEAGKRGATFHFTVPIKERRG